MTPVEFFAAAFAISVAAGLLGSLLGLGGGIVVIPALTLLLGVDIRYAIGASIVSVIATSSGAAAAYVRERMTNLRVAMFLELATTSGAITGAYLAGRHQRTLALPHLRARDGLLGPDDVPQAAARLSPPTVLPDALADRLRLHESYFDEAVGRGDCLSCRAIPASGSG